MVSSSTGRFPAAALIVCFISPAPFGDSFSPGQGITAVYTPLPSSPCSKSGSFVILQSFSYLGDLGVEDYGISTTTATDTRNVETQQTFPIQHLLQWQDDTSSTTKTFYEEASLPAPPLISNPYDSSTESWIPEDRQVAVTTPKVSAPLPQTSTSALTTTLNPRIGTNTNTHVNKQNPQNVRNIWETSAASIVQGTSLRTWNFVSPKLEAVQVLLKTTGRPLHANIELWQGEDHTPQKIAVYTEDGENRPFSAFLATPFRGPTAIAIKNSANAEFPLHACVEGDMYSSNRERTYGLSGGSGASSDPGYGNRLAQATLRRLYESAKPRVVQGGASYVIPFDEGVSRVQILITTEERPLNARIELLQGPNNIKQVVEVSTEDGMARPFFAVLETPGLGNAMRIVNTGPIEFPIDCRVEPFSVVADIENAYFFDTVGTSGLPEPKQSKNEQTNFFTKLLGGR